MEYIDVSKSETSDIVHQRRNKKTNSVFSDDIDAFPDVVELNVGGRYFATSVETLTRCKGSVLADLFSGDPRSLPRDKDGRFFIDADGVVFSHVLNYLRSNQLPHSEIVETVYNEAVVLGLEEFVSALESTPPILVKICRENTRNAIPGYKKFLSSLTDWITDDCKENIRGKSTIYIALQEMENDDSHTGGFDQNHICFGIHELPKSKVNADLHFGPWGSAIQASEEDMLSFIVSDVVQKGFTVSNFGRICESCRYTCQVGKQLKSCRRQLFHVTIQWWSLPFKSSSLKKVNFCNGATL